MFFRKHANKVAKVIGIDYSIRCPAICILDDDFRSSKFYYRTTVKKFAFSENNVEGVFHDLTKSEVRFEPYYENSIWAVSKIKPYLGENTSIIIEGHAYNAFGRGSQGLVENRYMLEYWLYVMLRRKVEVISPSVVKKFWTGNSNATKENMAEELKKREGVNILEWFGMNKLVSPAHDVLDSYVVALAGGLRNGN